MLWYAFVKMLMPQVAFDALYQEKNFIMSTSDFPGNNIHLDEGMEMGVIRHTKILNTCVPEVLEKSPGFLMILDRLRDALERNLDPSRKRSTSNSELKQPKVKSGRPRPTADPIGVITIEAERTIACNVSAMYSELKQHKWLGDENRGSELLMNVLRSVEPSPEAASQGIQRDSQPPYTIKSKAAAERLLIAHDTGRTVAALHVSAKLPDIFGSLSEEDINKFFEGKTLTGQWKTAFKFFNIDQLDPNTKYKDRGTKRGRSGKQSATLLFNRRNREVAKAKEELADVIMTAEGDRKDYALRLLADVKKFYHLLSDGASAFRKELDGEDPLHVSNRTFIQDLQDILKKTIVSFDKDMAFLHDGPLLPTFDYYSIHFDLTDIIHQTPLANLKDISVGGAIFDKMRRRLRNHIKLRTIPHAVYIHIQIDIRSLVPLQRSFSEDLFASQQAQAPHSEEEIVLVDYSTILEGTWNPLFKVKGNSSCLCMLHVLLAGKAALQLLKAEGDCEGASGSSSDGGDLAQCNVYIHAWIRYLDHGRCKNDKTG